MRTPTVRGYWGLLAGCLTLAPSVWAQVAPTSAELGQAQQQIEQGDFEEAVKTLQAGLSQPDVTDDQLVEYYRLLGLAQLYLGNEDGAREAYEKLLQARPDFELPRSAPPKLRKLYARIVDDIKRRRVRPVTLSPEPLTEARANEPLAVKARIEDLPLGARAKLYFRRAGAQTFSSVDFTRVQGVQNGFQAMVPAFELPAEPRPYELEYYIEVADLGQRRLAGKGDAFNPLTLHVPAASTETVAKADEGAWYKNPWVWVVGGAVAASATAGVILVATSQRTGTITITIRTQ